MIKPTPAQIHRVNDMLECLKVNKPKFTKADYSKFISKYKEEYLDSKFSEENYYDWDDGRSSNGL